MRSEEIGLLFTGLAMVFVGLLVFLSTVNNSSIRELEQQAIDRGYAEYVVERRSIKFQWIEPDELRKDIE